jgi:hypothetical protein
MVRRALALHTLQRFRLWFVGDFLNFATALRRCLRASLQSSSNQGLLIFRGFDELKGIVFLAISNNLFVKSKAGSGLSSNE